MRERGEEREREGGPSVRGERRKFNKTKCTYSPKTSDSPLSQRKDKRNKILIKKTSMALGWGAGTTGKES